MTKKDYVQIAAALVKDAPSGAPSWAKSADAEVKRAEERGWANAVQRIADVFAADNPRFDRDRFYRACGMESVK